jgi:hypothetical protein
MPAFKISSIMMMNSKTPTPSKTAAFYVLLAIITLLGVYLRLDQFGLQVLLDDEWHVLHQLLANPPSQLFLTFGHADFSIPLALFYWLEMNVFGLSELGMRWAMMLAGIAFVCMSIGHSITILLKIHGYVLAHLANFWDRNPLLLPNSEDPTLNSNPQSL